MANQSAKTKRKVKQTAVIPINWQIVSQSLMSGESGVSIASKIGVHENTLYLRCRDDLGLDFVAYKAQKKAEGDDLIHRKQFEIGVIKGNVSMLIWLGKQRLGQSDKTDASVNLSAQVTHTADDLAMQFLNYLLQNIPDIPKEKAVEAVRAKYGDVKLIED